MAKPVGLKLKWKNQLCLILVLCLGISQPLTAMAQVDEENLSKSPNLSLDVNEIVEYDPLPMPEDYPEDLNKFFDENVDARSFVVVDSETNRILAERQANVPYPIASMSKIISAYLVLKAIDEGRIDWDTEIEAPAEITDVLSDNLELSSAYLVAGEKYTVKDLLYGVMMVSGNDATSVLMWHLYGSEQEGTQAIIDQLHQWGFMDFKFYTTSGVPNLYLPEDWWMPGSNKTNENTMSAQDIALVAQNIITEYPEILEITSKMEYIFKQGTDQEMTFTNSNQLLPGQSHGREGITGLKSGSTDAAGKNFVATGEENGREIVAVAMGVFPREDGVETTSYWDIEILLDGLLEYPDLYKNKELPTNTKPTQEQRQAAMMSEEASESGDETQDETQDETNKNTNQRNNPITNFFGRIFKWFN